MFSFVTLLIILSDVVLNACTTLCMQCEGVCLWLPLSRGWLSVILWNSRWRAARTPGGPEAISAACRQMCPGSSQLEVLIPSTETDLHTELRPPFITAESWLGQVTRWDCACHPGHTLCQLKLFFISWMIDSSLIVLLLFSPCVKHGLERGNVWVRLLLFLKGKGFCRVSLWAFWWRAVSWGASTVLIERAILIFKSWQRTQTLKKISWTISNAAFWKIWLQ